MFLWVDAPTFSEVFGESAKIRTWGRDENVSVIKEYELDFSFHFLIPE